MANGTSAKFTLKGWNFKEWFVGNWATIKEVLKVGVPYLVGLTFFADNIPAQIGITAVGKFILDLGHYWAKD